MLFAFPSDQLFLPCSSAKFEPATIAIAGVDYFRNGNDRDLIIVDVGGHLEQEFALIEETIKISAAIVLSLCFKTKLIMLFISLSEF